MLPGTTPYISIEVEGTDLTNARDIFVSFKNQGRVFTFSGDRVTAALDNENTILVVHLTQEESLKFSGDTAGIQVKWKDQNGEVYGTETCIFPIDEVYYKAVI